MVDRSVIGFGGGRGICLDAHWVCANGHAGLINSINAIGAARNALHEGLEGNWWAQVCQNGREWAVRRPASIQTAVRVTRPAVCRVGHVRVVAMRGVAAADAVLQPRRRGVRDTGLSLYRGLQGALAGTGKHVHRLMRTEPPSFFGLCAYSGSCNF
jgi:hypothetical protein